MVAWQPVTAPLVIQQQQPQAYLYIYIYIRTVLISILPVTAPLVVQQQQPEACLYRIDHYWSRLLANCLIITILASDSKGELFCPRLPAAAGKVLTICLSGYLLWPVSQLTDCVYHTLSWYQDFRVWLCWTPVSADTDESSTPSGWLSSHLQHSHWLRWSLSVLHLKPCGQWYRKRHSGQELSQCLSECGRLPTVVLSTKDPAALLECLSCHEYSLWLFW